MAFFNSYYYFGLVLICYIKYLQANQCHECNTMTFNYSITADTLPSPNRSDCKIIPSDLLCYVAINWFNDGTSSVFYSAHIPLSSESIMTTTRRLIYTSNVYLSRRSIGYSCISSDTTPCNTVDKLKRSIISTSLPSEEQMKEFDKLIVPTIEFNSSSCFNYSNFTDDCPETDLVNCQQCLIAVNYAQQVDICAACPPGRDPHNSIDHQTVFYLNNRTEFHLVIIQCQTGNGCNTIENSEQVKQKLMSSFDFNKFSGSTALTSTSTVVILLAIFVKFNNKQL